MLLLLESVHATRQDILDDVHAHLLDRYLDQSVKPQRPPRFLLNDAHPLLANDVRRLRRQGA